MGMRLQIFLLLLVAAAWSQSRGGRLTARDTTIYRKPVSIAADSDQIPGTLVSPHVAWANPAACGRLNVLVISPCWTAVASVVRGAVTSTRRITGSC